MTDKNGRKRQIRRSTYVRSSLNDIIDLRSFDIEFRLDYLSDLLLAASNAVIKISPSAYPNLHPAAILKQKVLYTLLKCTIVDSCGS